MRKLPFIAAAVCVAAAALSGVGTAHAASMAEIVGAFSLACMSELDTPEKLSAHLGGAAKLLPEHAEGFLKPDRGVVYRSKFDNGGDMMTGLREKGGCKIFSKDAVRRDVEKMLVQDYRDTVRARMLGQESNES
jgi:hypothetical protein